MNILCYRYGSIVEPDIIDGFKELGNQVSEICLEIYNKNTTPLEGLTALKDELMRHSYDFVFSINFYPFIAEVCNIFQIRYLLSDGGRSGAGAFFQFDTASVEPHFSI